eukprot:TRINITY_DN19624_c0_g1_i2.p1 TRINITY_DN19624_c0_g1~~TRINITY_DN19624_c0_g1_i2.p1  ORF type:complete len:782 (+),score=181.45 TRINITY_DN19624_c0_g1_i2:152-2497(+)
MTYASSKSRNGGAKLMSAQQVTDGGFRGWGVFKHVNDRQATIAWQPNPPNSRTPYISVTDLHRMCFRKPENPLKRTKSLQELTRMASKVAVEAFEEERLQLQDRAFARSTGQLVRPKSLPQAVEGKQEALKAQQDSSSRPASSRSKERPLQAVSDSASSSTRPTSSSSKERPVHEEDDKVVRRRGSLSAKEFRRQFSRRTVSMMSTASVMTVSIQETASSDGSDENENDSDGSEDWSGEDSEEEEERFEKSRDENTRNRRARKTLVVAPDAGQIQALEDGIAFAERRRASLKADQLKSLTSLMDSHGEELALVNARRRPTVAKTEKFLEKTPEGAQLVQRRRAARKTVGAGTADIMQALQNLRQKSALDQVEEEEDDEDEDGDESPDENSKLPNVKKARLVSKARTSTRASLHGTLPKKKAPTLYVAPNLLPYCIKQMDYPTAMGFFDHYDKVRAGGATGELDRQAFADMLVGMTRDKEDMHRKWSDKIFAAIDCDEGGTVSREEFLGWVFQTHNNYLSSIRRRLEKLDPHKVKQLFKEIDSDLSGQIDKDEFFEFATRFCPDEGLSKQGCDELHSFIDKDGSGGIDIEEFLNWIHPGREIKLAMGGSDKVDAYTAFERSRSGGHKNQPEQWRTEGLIQKDGFEAPQKALMELGAKQPVVLEFWIGEAFRPDLKTIKSMIRAVFDQNQVKFAEVIEPLVRQQCNRVVAKVGRGIVFWDRQTMLPFMEDPFQNQRKTAEWLKGILSTCLPDVIAAANLRTIKKRQKFIQKGGAATTQARRQQ